MGKNLFTINSIDTLKSFLTEHFNNVDIRIDLKVYSKNKYEPWYGKYTLLYNNHIVLTTKEHKDFFINKYEGKNCISNRTKQSSSFWDSMAVLSLGNCLYFIQNSLHYQAEYCQAFRLLH